jgi:acetolactate synthase I/II/III large subunit
VFQPTRGEMVPLAIRQAWKTMVTGRPGPVVLDVLAGARLLAG